MLILSLWACGWLAEPDLAETEGAAIPHRDAIAAAAPAGSCDGVARLLANEDPGGCGARPAADLDEAVAVAERCATIGRSPGDPARDLMQAAHGVWTGAPIAVASCAAAIEKVAPRITWHHSYERPSLPSLEVLVHGARWQAWLVSAANPDQPAYLRGWWEVEQALGHCGPLDGEGCIDVIATRGAPDTRVDLREIEAKLRAVEIHLDRLDRMHATKRR